MSLSLITNGSVGFINGYNKKDNGVPNSIKYGIIGVTSVDGILKVLVNANIPDFIKSSSRQNLARIFIGIPLIMGTNFCIGHHIGKAVYYVENK